MQWKDVVTAHGCLRECSGNLTCALAELVGYKDKLENADLVSLVADIERADRAVKSAGESVQVVLNDVLDRQAGEGGDTSKA